MDPMLFKDLGLDFFFFSPLPFRGTLRTKKHRPLECPGFSSTALILNRAVSNGSSFYLIIVRNTTKTAEMAEHKRNKRQIKIVAQRKSHGLVFITVCIIWGRGLRPGARECSQDGPNAERRATGRHGPRHGCGSATVLGRPEHPGKPGGELHPHLPGARSQVCELRGVEVSIFPRFRPNSHVCPTERDFNGRDAGWSR